MLQALNLKLSALKYKLKALSFNPHALDNFILSKAQKYSNRLHFSIFF